MRRSVGCSFFREQFCGEFVSRHGLDRFCQRNVRFGLFDFDGFRFVFASYFFDRFSNSFFCIFFDRFLSRFFKGFFDCFFSRFLNGFFEDLFYCCFFRNPFRLFKNRLFYYFLRDLGNRFGR